MSFSSSSSQKLSRPPLENEDAARHDQSGNAFLTSPSTTEAALCFGVDSPSDTEPQAQRDVERYREFVRAAAEAIWCLEFEPPLPLQNGLSEDELISLAYERGSLVECNDVMARLYGYVASHELLGAGMEELIPRDDAQNRAYTLAFLRAGCKLRSAESVNTDADGRSKYFVNNLTGTVRDGCLWRVWGTQQDVTSQRRHELSVQQSQQFLQATLDALSSHVAILDARGEIIAVNEAWRRFARANDFEDAAHGLGSNYLEICASATGHDAAEANAVARGIRDVLDGRRADFYLEYPCSSSLGNFWFSIRVTYFTDPATENKPHVVIAHEDISERKRFEGALREETEALEALNRIGQVLSAELDGQKLVQAVIDEACALSGAEFGAFFARPSQPGDGALPPDALTGPVLRGRFGERRWEANFYQGAREAPVFAPAFRGEGVWRVDDMRSETRWSGREVWMGTPFEKLEVASYLAVPVRSRGGDVLGGLFFGHSQPGRFSERIERITVNLASQAAIAFDNARLFEDLKRQRSQVEASERYYRFLAESIPQIVWTTKPDGQIDYVNERWFDYIGQRAEQAMGYGWIEAVHPDDRERNQRLWRIAVQNGEPFEIEYRLRGRNGEYRWFLGLARPLRDSSGRVLKWFGTCTDIDDKKRAESALRCLADAGKVLSSSFDTEKHLQSVAQLVVPSISDWCSVDLLRPDGSLELLKVAHINAAKIEAAHELRRRFPVDLDAPEGMAEVLRSGRSQMFSAIDETLKEAARNEEHLALLRQLGLSSLMIVPLAARGAIFGVLSIGAAESGRQFNADDLDLARELAGRAAQAMDNARLYHEVQSALKTAEEAGRAKDDFLATVSHELRTPLTAILGWANLLKGDGIDDATLQRALETIERNVKSQAQIIEDLLDVSRIGAGKLRLEMQPLELTPIIQAALEAVRPAIEAKNIVVESQMARAGSVLGDPTRLQQIVWNLLSNATKFTPSGGLIRLDLENLGAQVRLTVEDSGPGISEEFLPHVFERFRQADTSSTRRHGGLGLGLAIVRHLVEMHGGTVRALPHQAGRGAVFVVELPLLSARNGEGADFGPHAAALRDESEDALLLHDVRILVVEDEDDAREMIVVALERYGARVRAVAAATDGFAELCRWKPDALVSDIGMPGEDGHDLIRRVRALDADGGGRVPAVALTAYARPEDRTRALAAGFQHHLPKPVSPVELALILAGLTGRVSDFNPPSSFPKIDQQLLAEG